MSHRTEKSKLARRLPTNKEALTQYALTEYTILLRSGRGVEEVPSQDQWARMVDYKGKWALYMDEEKCGCRDWKEMGMPCTHAVHFAHEHDQDARQYIADFWRAQNEVWY